MQIRLPAGTAEAARAEAGIGLQSGAVPDAIFQKGIAFFFGPAEGAAKRCSVGLTFCIEVKRMSY